MERVYDFLNSNLKFKENDNIVVGVSGGPDSMLLFHILLNLRNIYHFNIICCHINHNLRSESAYEAKFVEKNCKAYNVVFEYKNLYFNNDFTEALGHELRYEFFEEIIKKYQAKYFFTAHHGDDLIETVLMRLSRGSNLKGYAGFRPLIERNSYFSVKPLIFLTKEEIINYMHTNKLPYMIDKSNNNELYTRNRYRKNILPLLKQENANIHLKILKFSDLLYDYNNVIDNIVTKEYNRCIINNEICIDEILTNEDVIIRNILYKWLINFYKDNIKLINDKHIDILLDMMKSKNNKIVDLPKFSFVKNYNRIYLNTKKTNKYNILLNDKVELDNGYNIEIINSSEITTNYATYINSKEIELPLYVRNYNVGDRMTVKNMKGHKNIGDIFTNEKVPNDERSNYPVVVDSNNEVIWLPGLKKTSFDRKKDGMYDIIIKYYLREE